MHEMTVREREDLLEASGEETPFREYFVPVWRWRWLILGVSILCGAVTFGLMKRLPLVYEASAKLILAPPKALQAGEVVPAVSISTFRAIIENQAVATQVIREFKLDAPPMSLTPQRFLSSAMSLETPRDTNVVVLRVRLPNRDLAAKVANRVAELTVVLAERLSQDEGVRVRDYIKAQVDLSRAQLDAAEGRLRGFRQQAQVEALRQDVDAELKEGAGLLSLSLDIEAERARLAKAEEELAKRKPVTSLKRTIDNEPALMEAAKEREKPGLGVLGLEMKYEYPNSVYEQLDQQIANSRTRLSSLEKKRSELITARKAVSSEQGKASVLYAREAELTRLETEHELAKKVYVDAATRYDQARLQVAGRTAQLQLLDSALVPDVPVGPRVLRNTAAVSVVAFLFCALAVLFFTFVVAGMNSGAPPTKSAKPSTSSLSQPHDTAV